MTNVASVAGLAAVIGEPARAAMLLALMDGRALAAGELAAVSGVTAPTASGHLARLLEAGLLVPERNGRHRYFRLASTSIAELLETMMAMDGELRARAALDRRVRTGPREQALRRARLCYDHLAGEIAVGIAASMAERGQIDFAPDGGMLTEPGLAFLSALGVDLGAPPNGGTRARAFCRPCLDWSERRPHIGGVVGRALCRRLMEDGWIRKPASGRAVAITPRGQMELARHFGLRFA